MIIEPKEMREWVGGRKESKQWETEKGKWTDRQAKGGIQKEA